MKIVWRKWLRRIALALGVLMGLVAVAGFFLPASLEVKRERLIPVGAPALYERVASPRRWPEWATWWQREPFLEANYGGPPSGAGASLAWQSKREGSGKAKITAVVPNREIALAFDFGERGEALSVMTFEELPDQNHTRVIWKIRAHFGFNTGRRYFGLLFRSWLENDLDAGLANLEKAALAKSQPLPGTLPDPAIPSRPESH